MLTFPKDFLWGAATSSHQVEGNNVHNDWWQWEHASGSRTVSGQACRHYDLYREDFALARSLNHSAHRLSLEWSRIEPQENTFSDSEIRHYREVLACLKSHTIQPIVTLHHFTNPLWFMQKNGWEDTKSIALFLRYVERIVEALSEHVQYWITINEPTVYVYYAYMCGDWPPQKKSVYAGCRVLENLAHAHIEAYRIIHSVYRKKNLPAPQVSIAHNMQAFVACPSWKNRVALFLRERIFNFALLNKLARRKTLDFIGVNYYSRSLIDIKNLGANHLFMDVCGKGHQPLKKNSMGWDIYPEGLFTLLMQLKRYGRPVLVSENGICTDDDAQRWDFIKEHVKSIHAARSQGIEVIGYLYWSLLDNFEWDKGFVPRFGLIEVDYNTFSRKVRDSARKYAQLCARGELEE